MSYAGTANYKNTEGRTRVRPSDSTRAGDQRAAVRIDAIKPVAMAAMTISPLLSR
jgi:hypothetical protein